MLNRIRWGTQYSRVSGVLGPTGVHAGREPNGGGVNYPNGLGIELLHCPLVAICPKKLFLSGHAKELSNFTI